MLWYHLWHSSNIEPTLCRGIELPVFPAKMVPLANAVLQLSHGRRQWASSKLALGEVYLVKAYILLCQCWANAGPVLWTVGHYQANMCQWLEFADQLWPQPSRHKALTQCCSNAGPPSSTLAQHKNNIGSMPRDSWVGVHECQQSCRGRASHLPPPLSASLDTTVVCYGI